MRMDDKMKMQRMYWLLLAGAVLILAALVVFPRVGQPAPEPPNWSLIEPGLYMGGRVDKPPAGVGAVLNLSLQKDDYSAEAYRWEGIPDGEPLPTVEWLRKQVAFVDEQRKAGRTVFVHCDAGVSRSGLVMTAYLMWREHWTVEEALKYIREKREIVRPNMVFMGLLKEWERAVQGEVGGKGGGLIHKDILFNRRLIMEKTNPYAGLRPIVT